MSTLSRWVSPFDHRGMSIWGTIACLYLTYKLSEVQGELSEVWPNRCHMVRASFELHKECGERSDHLGVTFRSIPQNSTPSLEQIHSAGLWSISHPNPQSELTPRWLIPQRAYTGARVRLNRLTPIWVELYSDHEPSVMLIFERDQSMLHLYQYLVGDNDYSKIKRESEAGLSKLMSRISLEELSYQVSPSMITCQSEKLDDELPKLLSLMIKSAETGVYRATRWSQGLWELESELSGHQRRTIRRRLIDEGHHSMWSVSWSLKSDKTSQESLLKPHSEDSFMSAPPLWLSELLTVIDRSQGSTSKARDALRSLPSQVQLLEDG